MRRKELVQGARGHVWKLDEDGKIDDFAMDVDNLDGSWGGHNGPECTICGYTYCVHCDRDGPTEDCPGPALSGSQQ